MSNGWQMVLFNHFPSIINKVADETIPHKQRTVEPKAGTPTGMKSTVARFRLPQIRNFLPMEVPILSSRLLHQARENVLGLHWNTVANRILVVSQEGLLLKLEILHPLGGEILASTMVPVAGELKAVGLQDDLDFALLVFEQVAQIIDLRDGTTLIAFERERGFLGGEFGLNSEVHLTIPADSHCVDWCIWDYLANTSNEFRLERHDHYGRGAVLHPSKLLIGACWNAYQSGFLIHVPDPKNKRLLFYDFGKDACARPEYEAYAPTFSPDGDVFAFVANPYLGWHPNIEKLCAYRISRPNQPILEVDLADFAVESVIRTYFLGGTQYILLHKTNSLDLVDFQTGVLHRILTAEVDHVGVNPFTYEYVYATGNQITLCQLGDEGDCMPDFDPNAADEAAADFRMKFASKLRAVGDWE